jgi:hypothetical protein
MARAAVASGRLATPAGHSLIVCNKDDGLGYAK